VPQSFTKFFVKKFLGLDKGFNKPLSSCADKRKCYSDFAEKFLVRALGRKKGEII